MKREWLTDCMLVATLAAMADDGYPLLTLQTTAGTEVKMAVDKMTIAFVNGQLVATNSEGSQQIPLQDMKMMYFSETATQTVVTAIDGATATDEKVTVYTVGGRLMGSFDSVKEAREALRPGIYVMKTNTKTFKTTIK